MKTILPANIIRDDSSLMVAPVINTGHLTMATTFKLPSCDGFLAKPEHGSILYVPSYDERTRNEPYEKVPEKDLEILFSFMASRNYRFVRLDCDGDEIKGLPVYDWD